MDNGNTRKKRANPWNWGQVVAQMKIGVNSFCFGAGTRGRRLQEGLNYSIGEGKRLEGRRIVLWLNVESERPVSIDLKRTESRISERRVE